MTRITPPRLQPGDTVAAVTLSWGGPGAFPERYAVGKRQFEREFGCRVVRAIISTIGGDDSIRLLPYLDSSVMRGACRRFWSVAPADLTSRWPTT